MSPELIKALYPLGYLSTVAFGLRFFIQWLYSEVKGQSLVIRPFWWLSLVGNLLLLTHSLIQMQFHVSLVQAINAVISWRNLDLMKPGTGQKSLGFTLGLMALAILSVASFFIFTGQEWFHAPNATSPISMSWHILGLIGLILFSSRFVVQWWDAEWQHQSVLGLSFWSMSIAGGLLSILYFAELHDTVNLIGPSLGMIPYIRNFMLLIKHKSEHKSEQKKRVA